MNLFDKNISRTNRVAYQSESQYSYLNISSRKETGLVRDEIEKLFQNYPNDHKYELAQRMRSKDDIQFISCFWELLLYNFLSSFNYQIEIHPNGSDHKFTTPDFLVKSNTGEEFYIEAVIASDISDEEKGAIARLNNLYDSINKLILWRTR